MNIEGDTLFYADVNSDKYSALHGSNVERLEVVNRMQLEFVLKTKMSGPERGRSHSFRVSMCATIPALKCHAAYTCVCNATHGMPNMRAQLPEYSPCDLLLTAYVAYVRVCCAPVTYLPGHVRRRAEFAQWTSGLEQWLGSLAGPPPSAAPAPARIAVRRIPV